VRVQVPGQPRKPGLCGQRAPGRPGRRYPRRVQTPPATKKAARRGCRAADKDFRGHGERQPRTRAPGAARYHRATVPPSPARPGTQASPRVPRTTNESRAPPDQPRNPAGSRHPQVKHRRGVARVGQRHPQRSRAWRTSTGRYCHCAASRSSMKRPRVRGQRTQYQYLNQVAWAGDGSTAGGPRLAENQVTPG